MKTAFFVASAVLAVTISAPAQAQIKAGIAPKAKSVVLAERAAKAEREQQLASANESQQRHDQAFARMDTNGDGRISPEEYRAAGAVQEAHEDHLGQRGPQSR